MVLLVDMKTISLFGSIAKSLHIVWLFVFYTVNTVGVPGCSAYSVTKHCSRTLGKATTFLPQSSEIGVVVMISNSLASRHEG